MRRVILSSLASLAPPHFYRSLDYFQISSYLIYRGENRRQFRVLDAAPCIICTLIYAAAACLIQVGQVVWGKKQDERTNT